MRIFHPLRDKPTALLWAGLSLSAIGDQLYGVGVGWIGVGLLGARAGYLTSLQFVVLRLAALGIGRWADQWEQRRGMIGADLVRAVTLLAVTLLAVVAAWLAASTPSAAGLIGAIVVLALCQAIFQPALQTILPGVVADRAILPAANGLLDATDRSARLTGPGIVGVLASVVPTVHFLTIDTVSFMCSAADLLWIGRLRPNLVSPRATMREPAWRGVLRGIRALRAFPLLGYHLKVTGLMNGAWYALFFSALPLAIEQRGIHGPGGAGLGAYGLVISAYGFTNLAATLVFGSRLMPVRPQFQMFGGSIITGLGMMLIGPALLLPTDWVLPGMMSAAALSAIGGPMKDIPMAVLRQTRVAPADMGAAIRAIMAATSAGTLAALLLVPGLIAAAGVVPVIVGCGAIVTGIGVTALGLFSDWSEPVPTETVQKMA